MKKAILLTAAVIFLLASCAKTKQTSEVTISLFQNKVEIKDALDAYAAQYSQETPGVTIKVETFGGGGDYAGALKAKSQSGEIPDIFIIEGPGGYNLWKDYISDLSNESWTTDTELAFEADGKIVGFPVSIEGFGLAYNADILAKAGIDPAKLTTRAAYEEAFKIIDAKKAELGLTAVVSMAASLAGQMWWVTGHHSFSQYLGGGLEFTDTSVIDKALNGEVDVPRFTQYAKYVQLLLKYAEKKVLLNGSYDDQIVSFAQGKTAFLHQGNWVDPNLKQLGATFKMGYAPHAFLDTEQTGLYLFAPSFYCVNSKGKNVQAAKDFLTAMATTTAGHEYIAGKAGMIPAFKSAAIQPPGQLSQALMVANTQGGNYGVFFGMLPDGSGKGTFAPIFELFAQNPDTINQFISDMQKAIADL